MMSEQLFRFITFIRLEVRGALRSLTLGHVSRHITPLPSRWLGMNEPPNFRDVWFLPNFRSMNSISYFVVFVIFKVACFTSKDVLYLQSDSWSNHFRIITFLHFRRFRIFSDISIDLNGLGSFLTSIWSGNISLNLCKFSFRNTHV